MGTLTKCSYPLNIYNESTHNMKPTVREIEEYMASLNIPMEQGFNGTAASDFNVVSKPKHYMLFDEYQIKCKAQENLGIEVRDVLEMLVLKLEPKDGLFESDYVQLMQYLMRFMDKNGKEDLEKARWYLDKMISAY